MDDIRYDLRYLTDPQVFAVGRLPAVSDHDVFASVAEAAQGHSSLSLCLDGRWKFACAETPEARPVGFAAPEYDCAAWGEIDVPAHIQLQGHGAPHYVNTQYPWDGHEALRPPQIPVRENPVGCYVKHFTAPQGWAGHRVTLVLHGGGDRLLRVAERCAAGLRGGQLHPLALRPDRRAAGRRQ